MGTRSLVGAVTGTLSARHASAATLTPEGGGIDFAIGGLGFKLAINDKQPYERATAQFRKEQFDSAPNVGDQSLTGWWTRGQLSFHRGAGVKYYEVLDGETVLNRYRSSVGVDPRKPGSVTLLPEGSRVNTSTLSRLTTNRSGRSETFAAVTTGAGAVLLSGASATTLTTSAGGSVSSVASGAGQAFFATDSGIEQVPATGTTLTLICAKDAAATNGKHVGVWWAKNRIWTVNGDGSWYTAAASGAAMDSTSKLWASGLPSVAGSWSLAAGPGSVYLAYGSQIFAVTLDTDGSVPAVAAGTTVVELPNDETIQGMTYALGYLVVCTTKGVRVAVTDTNNVVIGPRVLDGNVTSAKQDGSTVLVGTTTGTYAVDLGQPINGQDLTFAWFQWGTVAGRVADSASGRYVLAADGLYSLPSSGSLVTQGELTTGYHRFGTLEPKQFHAVKVRVAGTGGTVQVSRVMADGSAVLLYSIDVANMLDGDITLGMPEPAEMVALRFTLTRDADDPSQGPELLGYQLKALPAPRRQRMIRVPLMVFDVEARSPGRAVGRESQAWERLRALEELEEGGGTHMFQDFRTGEAGLCYVESVEHTGVTPPGPRDNGFGGVVFLTLRKVDG